MIVTFEMESKTKLIRIFLGKNDSTRNLGAYAKMFRFMHSGKPYVLYEMQSRLEYRMINQ